MSDNVFQHDTTPPFIPSQEEREKGGGNRGEKRAGHFEKSFKKEK